jgi:hypothetical protein
MADEQVGNRANAAGLRASRAWLLGRGLAAEVEQVRFTGGGAPVPAPGLPQLLDRLEQDLRDVLALSDRVDALLGGPERAVDLPAIVAVELGAAEEGADEIERVTRQLAQLALGVSTGMPPSKRAERLDGAAVAVLHPPAGSGRTVHLIDDGLELLGSDRRELEVELRGLCCRMLLDGEVSARFGEVVLRVGTDQVLHLITPEGALSWEAPVEVTLPAVAAVAALKDLGMSTKKIRRAATVG